MPKSCLKLFSMRTGRSQSLAILILLTFSALILPYSSPAFTGGVSTPSAAMRGAIPTATGWSNSELHQAVNSYHSAVLAQAPPSVPPISKLSTAETGQSLTFYPDFSNYPDDNTGCNALSSYTYYPPGALIGSAPTRSTNLPIDPEYSDGYGASFCSFNYTGTTYSVSIAQASLYLFTGDSGTPSWNVSVQVIDLTSCTSFPDATGCPVIAAGTDNAITNIPYASNCSASSLVQVDLTPLGSVTSGHSLGLLVNASYSSPNNYYDLELCTGPASTSSSSSSISLLAANSSPTSVECTPAFVAPSYSTTCTASIIGSLPTGNVSFTSSSSTGSFTPSNGVCTLSSGSCSVNYSDTTLGTVSITGSYGGDSNNNPSSGAFALAVTRPSSVNVDCTPSPVPEATAATCTAAIMGTAPTGIVTWSSSAAGDFNSTSCTLAPSGSCSVTYTPRSPSSPVTIEASYSGDASNAYSTGSFSLGISQAASSTTISCTPSSIQVNDQASCTATVAGISPTGTVAFSTSSTDGGGVTPASASCTLTYGSCSVSFSGLLDHVGSVTITGSYSGDANNLDSSGQFSLTVAKSPTSTGVVCDPASMLVDSSTVCTASVYASVDVPAGNGPYGIAYDPSNGYIYVANEGVYPNFDDTVSVIDGATNNIIATVTVGYAPYAVAYDAANGYIYVANGGSGLGDTVSVIDGTTVIATLVVGGGYQYAAPDGLAYDSANQNMYVSLAGMDALAVINSTNRVIATIGIDNCFVCIFNTGPQGLAFDPLNGYIYVGEADPYGTMAVVDGSTNTLIKVFGQQDISEINSVAFDPANGNLYAVSAATSTVYVIDSSTNTVNYIQTYLVDSFFDGIAYDSNNQNMYVASGSGVLVVIDSSTNTVAGTITATSGAAGVAFDTANNDIYVANWDDPGSVSIIGTPAGIRGETSTFEHSGGTGTVSFDSTTCTLSSAGTCSVSAAGVSLGSATILASYPGDSNYEPSSGTFTLNVQTAVTVSVSCSPSPVDVTSATTCTASVSGASPSGEVSWSTSGQGGFSLGSCTLSSGSCSVKYTPSSTLSTVINATYNGDTNNSPGYGTYSLPINPAATTITVICSPSPVDENTPTTCTASLSVGSATGSIIWSSSDTGNFNSTSCALSSGSCSVTYTPSSSTTPVTITASYGGDSNYASGSGIFSLGVVGSTTTGTSTSSTSESTSSGGSSCGCTTTGPFVNPTVSNKKGSSPDGKYTTQIATVSGQTVVEVLKSGSVMFYSEPNPDAWGWSPAGDYFAVASNPGNQLDTLYIEVYAVNGNTPGNPVVTDIITYSGGMPPSGSSGDSDSYGAASWGFSHDGSTFVISYIAGNNGQVTLHTWSDITGASIQPTGSFGNPVSMLIQFSPCGDLLMVALQTSASGSNIGSAYFYNASTGSIYQTVQITNTAISASVAKVNGNYVVQLTGMNPSSFASPQCGGGSTTTTTSTMSSTSSSCGCTKTGPFANANVTSRKGNSPDGVYIVSVANVVEVSKNGAVIVTSPENPLSWGWSPSGDYFVVASNPGGLTDTLRLSVYNLKGSSPGTATVNDQIIYGAGLPPSSGDSYGAAGWGFSPDGATFIVIYIDANGQVNLHVWSSPSGAEVTQPSGNYGNPTSALFQFSPCSDLFMVALQSTYTNTASFYYTSSGSLYKSVPIISSSFGASTSKQGSGSSTYVVQLAGSSVSSFASPQCTSATISGDAPYTILVTDSLGRSVGYDPSTGLVVNDIPGANYSGVDSDPQVVTIPDPSGAYTIVLTGKGGGGSYTLDEVFSNGDTTLQTLSSTGTIGSTQTLSFEYYAPDLLTTEVTGTLSASSVSINAPPEVLFSGNVATFTDSDGNSNVTAYTAMIDWGDGTQSAANITFSGGTFVVSGQHTYFSSGVYVTVVVITDSDGNSASITGLGNVGSLVQGVPEFPVGLAPPIALLILGLVLISVRKRPPVG